VHNENVDYTTDRRRYRLHSNNLKIDWNNLHLTCRKYYSIMDTVFIIGGMSDGKYGSAQSICHIARFFG